MGEIRIHSAPSRAAAAALLESANLPTTDLTDAHMGLFFYLGPTEAPIGLIGLELCGRDALLRSLVVAAAQRGCGMGALLLAHAEEVARVRGTERIYLLTTTAEKFFRGHGYASARRDEAPLGIQSTREFSGICPASSAFMFKTLVARLP